MSCKKEGFVSIRHNDLRDLRATIVSEVCKDTEIKPRLLPLSGEELHGRTTNRMRQDWTLEHEDFGIEVNRHFSIPNASRYLNKSQQQCRAMNEHGKKRSYNERLLQVEHGTFTPLVLSINGGMGRE